MLIYDLHSQLITLGEVAGGLRLLLIVLSMMTLFLSSSLPLLDLLVGHMVFIEHKQRL